MWLGDDTAVVGADGPVLFATDLVAEGVHFERALSSLADVGWKVLTANVSDVAAMGGRPSRAVVAVAGAWDDDLAALYEGLGEAAAAYDCPVVGGDLSAAPVGGGLVVSVAVLGTLDGRPPVLRSGGRPGDRLYLTGPLGAAAAGLAVLRDRHGGPVDPGDLALVGAHRRPVARLAEGRRAALAGATAMIDVSDGLGLDLDRLCRASGVGVELHTLPCAPGATPDDALGGGEDYELLVAVPEGVDLAGAFEGAGLARPIEVGRLVGDATVRTLEGRPLEPAGYRHRA